MEDEYYEQLENLLLSGEKENIKLAFVLEQSLNLDLTPILRRMQKAIMLSGYGYESMPLEDIPEQLSYIESISVGTNVDFEDALRYLGNVRNLYLYDNSEGAFFDFYGDLSHLEELSIESTFLKKLPDWVCKLKRLKNLNLNCKNLSLLPENFGNLSSLETITFDCSQQLSIPNSAKKIPKIKLFTSYYFIPLKFSNFSAIEQCNWNSITNIPEPLEDLVIDEIFLSGHLIMPENTHFLGQVNILNLYLYNSPKEKIAQKFAGLKKVKRLILNFSEFGLPDEIFSIPQVEELVFVYARFYEIPAAMGHLKDSLKTLELSYCDIPDNFIDEFKKILPNTNIVEQYNNYGMTKERYRKERISSLVNSIKRWLFFITLISLLILLVYWILYGISLLFQ